MDNVDKIEGVDILRWGIFPAIITFLLLFSTLSYFKVGSEYKDYTKAEKIECSKKDFWLEELKKKSKETLISD